VAGHFLKLKRGKSKTILAAVGRLLRHDHSSALAMQSPAAGSCLLLLVVVTVLAAGSASAATLAPVEFSIVDYTR